MKVEKEINWNVFYIGMSIFGAIIFIAIYGVTILNPLYDDWLLVGGDLSQHYIGWLFYRDGAWTFPFGLTDQLAYPSYSSVIFTDSIPLFAVFFKMFSGILPDTFQYFGWWGIVSFMLQAFLTSLILKEFSFSKIQIFFTSIFFIISAPILEKMFRHTSLGGHWIILFAIYLFVIHKKLYKHTIKAALLWGIIGFLISAIHLYYLPMCGIFMLGFILASILEERKITGKIILPVITFGIALLGTTYVLGGFSTKTAGESDGLGYFSFNLNGFFNAKGYSRILPTLQTYKDGQYEGFAYLGLGGIILLIFGIAFFILNRRNLVKDIKLASIYCLMSLGLIFFATSPEVSFGNVLLFEFPDIDMIIKYWSYFRSSGRIIWPVCYLIFLFSSVQFVRFGSGEKKRERLVTILFFVVAMTQLFDFSGKVKELHDIYSYKVEYNSPLQDEIWDKLAERKEYKHIVWTSHHIDNGKIMSVSKYANENNLTMNNFYFARGINVNEATKASLQELKDDIIYIFRPEEEEMTKEYKLHYYYVDDLIIGLTKDIL